ncbi:MAG: hypothetical protein ABI789_03150, partial [Usitatibacter sp.]
MNTQLNKRRIATVLVAASVALMTGCTMMDNMMGRDKAEEHGGTRAGVAAMGRMEAVTLTGSH